MMAEIWEDRYIREIPSSEPAPNVNPSFVDMTNDQSNFGRIFCVIIWQHLSQVGL